MLAEMATETGAKKRKVSDEDEKNVAATNQSFGGFEVFRILSDNTKNKCQFLHGKFKGEDAVVLLEKTPFDDQQAQEILSSKTSLTETLKNDIYSTYLAYPEPLLNAVKATLIHPATPKHISKYTKQEVFMVRETGDIYQNVTLPFLESHPLSIQWVYNILDKKSEADRIVFEDGSPDKGFILLPDMKWDRKDTNALYLQAIVHAHDIKSIRSLDHTHLPLLRNILHRGQAAIMEKFGVEASKLRMYLHYLPSYYHLHVHFMHINLDNPGFEADRAHLLTDVIENIEMKSDYYKTKTLVYKVREQDQLYKELVQYGYFKKSVD